MNADDDGPHNNWGYAIWFDENSCTCEHTPIEHCGGDIQSTGRCEVDDCTCEANWIDDF